MSLWIPLLDVLWQLRPVFPRKITFLFFVAAVVGFCTRTDNRGVTSFVRTLCLKASAYAGFLRLFHCRALEPGALFDAWTTIAVRIFGKACVHCGERLVIVADGLKVPKEARRMPGVKSLHQQSSNNSKPEWIMGHSFQAIGMIVEGLGRLFCVPLSSRIHEGLTTSNRDSKTLVDKLFVELLWLPLPRPFIFVADSYYCAHTGAQLLKEFACDLISPVRSNAVAFRLPLPKKSGRGRKPKYGQKVKLTDFFKGSLVSTTVNAYGHKALPIRYWTEDLLWQKYGGLVRYVGSVLPSGKRAVFLCTDLTLSPERIIELYAMRMRIEQSFKVAVRQLGSYAYHFWSKMMDKIKRGSKGQFLHKKPAQVRDALKEKLASCERFVATGLVAQGLLQYLAVCFPALVWQNFRGWYRTLLTAHSPTEEIVAATLRTRLPEILGGSLQSPIFMKFVESKIDTGRITEQFKQTG